MTQFGTLERIKYNIGFIREVYTRFFEDNIPIVAGAVSFFTMVSLIPLLLFGVLIAYNLHMLDIVNNQIDQYSKIALTHAFADALKKQIELVIQNRQIIAILLVSVALWTGSQVFLVLESAINMVWRTRKRRSFWWRRLLSVLMVLLVGTMMIGAFLLMNSIRILQVFSIPLFGYNTDEISWFIRVLVSVIVPILLVSGIFSIIYCVLPTKNVTFRTVVPGAVASAICWSVSLNFFSWYAVHFISSYSFLLGSLFVGLVFLMFWFYYSAFIMLLGAEISAVFHSRLVEEGDIVERKLDEEDRNLPPPPTDPFLTETMRA